MELINIQFWHFNLVISEKFIFILFIFVDNSSFSNSWSFGYRGWRAGENQVCYVYLHWFLFLLF